ncbi:septal ring lytic transglycosylase RlpA family protein [Altererythrobacter sp.]|uniref:septal ring lytic transglycosylase RlpA family protein n=1 Tax=Altererythrobacter sp. TaxID=1872480 RepID=UPI003CFE4F3C
MVPIVLLTGPSASLAEDAEGVQQPRFALEFAPFDEDPPAYIPVDGAVDITSLEIPFETVGQQLGSGMASYYGRKFHGRRTASGERFDMNALTAAHRTLPFGSLVRVTNPRNGRSVVVRINDRGPFARGRMIDLSRAAAEQIGLIRRGHGKVELALLKP